jgi:hypothetical protein
MANSGASGYAGEIIASGSFDCNTYNRTQITGLTTGNVYAIENKGTPYLYPVSPPTNNYDYWLYVGANLISDGYAFAPNGIDPFDAYAETFGNYTRYFFKEGASGTWISNSPLHFLRNPTSGNLSYDIYTAGQDRTLYINQSAIFNSL